MPVNNIFEWGRRSDTSRMNLNINLENSRQYFSPSEATSYLDKAELIFHEDRSPPPLLRQLEDADAQIFPFEEISRDKKPRRAVLQYYCSIAEQSARLRSVD